MILFTMMNTVAVFCGESSSNCFFHKCMEESVVTYHLVHHYQGRPALFGKNVVNKAYEVSENISSGVSERLLGSYISQFYIMVHKGMIVCELVNLSETL